MKARWPYRFVLESLGPGTSRRDLDADLRIKARRGVFMEKIREVGVGIAVFSSTDRYVAELILWQILS